MSKLLRRILYLFRQRRIERELAEEMAFHRSMVGGPAFGNATLAREDARNVWLLPWIESVWQDIFYAIRALWREPGFALKIVSCSSFG